MFDLVLLCVQVLAEMPGACSTLEEAARALKSQPREDRKKHAQRLSAILEDAQDHGDENSLCDELEEFTEDLGAR